MDIGYNILEVGRLSQELEDSVSSWDIMHIFPEEVAAEIENSF